MQLYDVGHAPRVCAAYVCSTSYTFPTSATRAVIMLRGAYAMFSRVFFSVFPSQVAQTPFLGPLYLDYSIATKPTTGGCDLSSKERAAAARVSPRCARVL